MPLDGQLLATEIQDAVSWDGEQLQPFSEAIGNGIVLGTSGVLQFITVDTGTTPGIGNGQVTGIQGIRPDQMSQAIFDAGQSFWKPDQRDGPGKEWQKFCDQLSSVIADHFKQNAQLSSQHSPVFLGNGQVQQYLGLVPQSVAGQIISMAPSDWASARFSELAQAVAQGYVQEILGHPPSDAVTIAGSFTGPTPPGPVPGTGSGSGSVL